MDYLPISESSDSSDCSYDFISQAKWPFKEYQCNHCGTHYSSKKSLIDHIYTECLEQLYYMCPYCERKFRKPDDVYAHVGKSHAGKAIYSEDAPVRRKHKCKTCRYACESKAMLRYHKLTNHDKTHKWECPYCSYQLSERNGIHRHVKKEHLNKKVYAMLRRHYSTTSNKCKYCEREFIHRDNLEKHMRNYCKMRPMKKRRKIAIRRSNRQQRVVDRAAENNSDDLKMDVTASYKCSFEGCDYVGPNAASLETHRHLECAKNKKLIDKFKELQLIRDCNGRRLLKFVPLSKKYQCPHCALNFETEENLRKHLISACRERQSVIIYL